MSIPTLDEIQQRFQIGDYIEYMTGCGLFTGLIVGYELNRNGICLDLGDRWFPVWQYADFEMAEKHHRTAESYLLNPLPTKYIQITFF